MQVTICGIEFNIDYKYMGKRTPSNFHDNAPHNYYRIFLKRGKNLITFEFYDSILNTESGIKTLSNNGLLDAFNCFLMDCIAFSNNDSLANFMHEFDYNNMEDAKHAYEGCCNSYFNCMEIMTKQEMYDVNSYLCEKGH